ncbi:MAG: HIT domain-containing protein [Candidatus Paceibacterota bacterium]
MNEPKESCIFCKIAKGKIPCHKIFEDKNFLAFLDIQPVSHGHILIIPKKHIVWMYEVDDKIIAGIFKLTKKLMLALKKSMKCDYVQEWVSGEEIPHFHIHLLPRYSTDDLPNPKRKKYLEGEAENVINKIISML